MSGPRQGSITNDLGYTGGLINGWIQASGCEAKMGARLAVQLVWTISFASTIKMDIPD